MNFRNSIDFSRTCCDHFDNNMIIGSTKPTDVNNSVYLVTDDVEIS